MSRIEHALVYILESIAAEEEALATLVRAETEIVKLFDRTLPHLGTQPTVDELVALNTSIDRILLTVLTKERVLQNKLDVATSLLHNLLTEQADEDNSEDTEEREEE